MTPATPVIIPLENSSRNHMDRFKKSANMR